MRRVAEVSYSVRLFETIACLSSFSYSFIISISSFIISISPFIMLGGLGQQLLLLCVLHYPIRVASRCICLFVDENIKVKFTVPPLPTPKAVFSFCFCGKDRLLWKYMYVIYRECASLTNSTALPVVLDFSFSGVSVLMEVRKGECVPIVTRSTISFPLIHILLILRGAITLLFYLRSSSFFTSWSCLCSLEPLPFSLILGCVSVSITLMHVWSNYYHCPVL